MNTQIPDIERRRLARLSAVQALYQMEMANQKSKLVVREFNEHWFENAAREGDITAESDFFELLVLGVVAEQDIIDKAIVGKLNKKWTLKRLDVILRAILRCASFEMLRLFDVPGIVIVDQYVGLTRDFYEGNEANFINAALDKLAREVRPAEFELSAGAGAEAVDG